MISTTQKKIITTLNDPRLKKTANDIAREKLTLALLKLKEGEEILTGKSISGFHFYKEFNLDNLTDAKEALTRTVKDIANHAGVK